jgi:hypothetical protein
MKKNFKKSQLVPGRWIRIRYSDVGVRDVILTDINQRQKDANGMGWPTEYKVFEPSEKGRANDTVDYSQIVAVGPYVNAPAF